MRSPNTFNHNEKAPESAERSGWDSLADEAQHKEWPTQNTEEFTPQSPQDKEAELNKLHEKAKEQALRINAEMQAEKFYEENKTEQPKRELSEEKLGVKTEQPKPELTELEKLEQREERNRELALIFAEHIGPETLKECSVNEMAKVKMIKDGIERHQSDKKDKSFLGNILGKASKLEELEEELARYGCARDGYKSPTYKDLEELGKPYSHQPKDREEFAKRRALKWKTIDINLKSPDGSQIKKALKKAGFKKIPEKWNDKDFTSDEIARMAAVVADYNFSKKDELQEKNQ